ncbi:MAG TPA: SCO family protein [Candidatus Azoamicus sp.]
MIYTNCKTICPIIIANMKAIEKLVLSNGIKNISFSLVSLDSDRDSVETLNKYFYEKKMNPFLWNLYKSSKNETLKLALATGIKYKKEKNNEYTHSNLIIILDKDGVIKMHHQGLDKNFNLILKLIFDLSK